MKDRFEFTVERKKQTIELIDQLADVIDATDVDDSVVIAALGSLLLIKQPLAGMPEH